MHYSEPDKFRNGKMKALKIACFLLGVIHVVRMVLMYIQIPDISTDQMESAVSQQQLQQGTTIALTMVVSAISATLCVLLAKKLKRSAAGWGIFGFFLPYIACFILPFLKEADPQKKTSWWSSQQGSGSSWGSGYGTSYYSRKTCSACGREVPSDSHAGQYCPHCRAYWGSENKRY